MVITDLTAQHLCMFSRSKSQVLPSHKGGGYTRVWILAGKVMDVICLPHFLPVLKPRINRGRTAVFLSHTLRSATGGIQWGGKKMKKHFLFPFSFLDRNKGDTIFCSTQMIKHMFHLLYTVIFFFLSCDIIYSFGVISKNVYLWFHFKK